MRADVEARSPLSSSTLSILLLLFEIESLAGPCIHCLGRPAGQQSPRIHLSLLASIGIAACVYHSLHSFGTDLTRMMEELQNGRHMYRKAKVGGRLYALMEMHKSAGNSGKSPRRLV